MNKKTEQAAQAGTAKSREIIRETLPHAGDSDYVLVYLSMVLSGLLGMATAELGEDGAFELWDMVKNTGRKGMAIINGGSAATH